MLKGITVIFALSCLGKACSNVDFVDPLSVVEMVEIEMSKEYKDVPAEARPYCRLLDEEDDRKNKEREEEDFKKTGYNFEYGVVDGIFSFFFGD